MLIFNKYENDLDRAWFSSSNIKYAECDDKTDSLKTVRIVFNTGRKYEYEKVTVQDYLLFRNAESQGKAFNSYLRKYEAKRLEDADLDQIDKELENLRSADFVLVYTETGFNIKNNSGNVLFELDRKLSEDEMNLIESVLNVVEVRFRVEGKEDVK